MESQNKINSQLFEQKIEPLFERFKKLPQHGQQNNSFIVVSGTEQLHVELRKILKEIDAQYSFEKFKVLSGSYIVDFGEGVKTVLIFTIAEDFDFAYDYHSYYISAIIGKIFNKANLKYTDEGLFYVQYDLRPNHRSEVTRLKITPNFKTVLELLQLDYEEFKKGFANTDEIFAFICKSPFLKVEAFRDLEKEARMFILQAFQEYLILNKVQSEGRKLTLEMVNEIVPEIDLFEKIKQMEKQAQDKLELVQKFDGSTIIKLMPEFDKKKIPMAYSILMRSFGSKEAFREYLRTHTQEEVFTKFKELNQLQ